MRTSDMSNFDNTGKKDPPSLRKNVFIKKNNEESMCNLTYQLFLSWRNN